MPMFGSLRLSWSSFSRIICNSAPVRKIKRSLTYDSASPLKGIDKKTHVCEENPTGFFIFLDYDKFVLMGL